MNYIRIIHGISGLLVTLPYKFTFDIYLHNLNLYTDSPV